MRPAPGCRRSRPHTAGRRSGPGPRRTATPGRTGRPPPDPGTVHRRSSGHCCTGPRGPDTVHSPRSPGPSASPNWPAAGSPHPDTWSRPAGTAPAPCPPAPAYSCHRSAGWPWRRRSWLAPRCGRRPGPARPAWPAVRPWCSSGRTAGRRGPPDSYIGRAPGSKFPV